jgi:hypothetical protein
MTGLHLERDQPMLKLEMEQQLSEARELLRDCRRYLTEFGSIDPGLLARRIDQFENQAVIRRARNGP